VYARNVIRKLSLRRQHKAKTVTLSTIDETMVERFERLQMALRMTTDGWCPTTPTLPRCFNAHINIEVSTDIRNVKYLFKYLYEGLDRVVVVIVGPINEIQQYINTRYLSIAEGVNYLLSFKKHMKWPLVTRLVVHLLGQHNVIFNKNEDLAVVVERAAHQKTTLTAYFVCNAQNADGQNVVYADFLADHV
jgi:hypothetical protein